MTTPEERFWKFKDENEDQLKDRSPDDVAIACCNNEHEATKAIILQKTKLLFKPNKGEWP